MYIFKNRTNFLAKLSFVSTLSCKAMESNNLDSIISKNSSKINNIDIIKEETTQYEELFNNVFNKKYNSSNGKLLLFRKASNCDIIEMSKTLLMTINNDKYYISIDKNSKISYLDIFDNTDIEYLSLFTAKRPIPSLKNCNKLTKIQLSFDDEEDTEYLKDILEVIKNVKNLKELNLSYLYYYCNRFNKDILIIIDNIITSLKEEFPNLKYIFPNIYSKNSCDYNFIDFKNKKEIFDIVTIDSETLFSDYRIVIGKNLEILEKNEDKLSDYVKKLDDDLLKKENDLNNLKSKIQTYNKMPKNDLLKENNKVIIKNLKITEQILEDQINNLKKEQNDLLKLYLKFNQKRVFLDKENSFINSIQNKIINKEYDNFKEIYEFILKNRKGGKYCPKLDFIYPFGEDCAICLGNMTIDDICNDYIEKLSCNHIFHKDCINTWLKDKKTCPLCREKIDNNQ